jgi:hypothetical protein
LVGLNSGDQYKLRLLDLCSIRPTPSFWFTPRDERGKIRFLHAFTESITQPVVHDGREHIESAASLPKKKRGIWSMLLRFDANYGDPALAFDPLVDEVFAELKSSFLEMPRGGGFVDYATFEKGYTRRSNAQRTRSSM